MTVPEIIELTVLEGQANLRIFVRQPERPGGGRRGQEKMYPVGVQALDTGIEPIESENPLFGLERAPGENAEVHVIDPGRFHQPDILLEYLRAMQPLFRVVVAAVQQRKGFGVFHHFQDRQVIRMQIGSEPPAEVAKLTEAPDRLKPSLTESNLSSAKFHSCLISGTNRA